MTSDRLALPTQLKLRHLNPRNELTTQVSNDHWTFSYNFKNKVSTPSDARRVIDRTAAALTGH